MSTTTTLLLEVISSQIDWLVDQLVELQIVFQQGEISIREYNIKSEEYHSKLEALREQQAIW
jgi:hypothetical protein